MSDTDTLRSGRAAESSHWYTRSGQAAYEVPKASGDGMRATNVKDARKLGLVPSVTTITKLVANPGLDAWKTDQVALAALTTPREVGLTDKEFLGLVKKAAGAEATRAAEFGTAAHKWIELALRDTAESHLVQVTDRVEREIPDNMDKIVKGVLSVMPSEVPLANWSTEDSYTADTGGDLWYGGLLDAWGDATNGMIHVVDFKGRKTWRNGKPPTSYDAEVMQLASYGFMLLSRLYPSPSQHFDKLECSNIFFDRDEPGRVHVETHRHPERLLAAFKKFACLLEFFYLDRGL